MNTCDSCKWWKVVANQFVPKGWGKCESNKMDLVDTKRLYFFNGIYYDDYDSIPNMDSSVELVGWRTTSKNDDSFYPLSDSEYHNAEFITGPKFGCIHFEAKN